MAADYTFEPILAIDAVTLAPVGGVTGTVTDADTGSPVTTYNMGGVATPLVTNARGYIPQFKASAPRIAVAFGSLTMEKEAIENDTRIIDEAVAANTAALTGTFVNKAEAVSVNDATVNAVVTTPTSAARQSLDADFAPKKVTAAAEAFNLPTLTSGGGVNPTVVIGVDPVSGLIYGADRTTNDISMSADGGATWQHDRGTPGGTAVVNHVQLHKVVRYGAHIYLFAISSVDARAGVYRAPAPTAATDLIQWDGRTNKITNPSFEAGTTGWTTGGSVSVTNPTDGGYIGTRYARVTALGAGTFAFYAPTFPVTAGQQFAASAYVRGTPGIQGNIRITWTGATATAAIAQSINSDTEWQRLTFTGTVPAGATAARVEVRVDAAGVIAGTYVDVDAVLTELGTATVGTYIDTTAPTRYATMKASTSVTGANSETMNGKSTAFNAGTSAIVLGDYGDFTGGPTLQRTLDGTTWETVWTGLTSRHVHGVAEDPYTPGHWYATIGDGAGNMVNVVRSTDNGATWTTILDGTGGTNLYQSVQVSFSAKYVYLAADHYGSSAFYFDRDELVIRNLNGSPHTMVAIPGGVGGRIITDLATTSGSTTVTSASFTSFDKGKEIRADNLPLFAEFSNAAEPNWLTAAGDGTATARKAATATGTGLTAFIGGDRFYAGSYLGAVDPDTDIFYFTAMDTSSAGNTYGVFYLTHPGARPELLASLPALGVPTTWRAIDEVYVFDGWVYTGTRRFPAIPL